MFSGIGLPEVLIVLVIALVVLGPKRLPEVGKSLGRGMREFKDSISGDSKDDDDRDEIEGLGRTSASTTTPVTPQPTTTTPVEPNRSTDA